MKRNIAPVLILAVASLLYACGGGGGGSAASAFAPSAAVNLSVIKNFAEAQIPGSAMSFNVKGSNSLGADISGTLSLTISSPTVASTPTGTQTVNVLVQDVSITNVSSGASVTTRSTSYYYQDGFLYQTVHADGTISMPISQSLLPSTANVGDSGDDMVVINSDGSTETSTWRIEPGAGDDANIVFVYTYRNAGNVVTGTEEDSFTINPDGSISATSVMFFDVSSGVTVSFSGSRS